MVPRDVNILPWYAGYTEAINAGKSLRNEDQAAFHRGVLRTQDLPDDEQYATGKENMKKLIHIILLLLFLYVAKLKSR